MELPCGLGFCRLEGSRLVLVDFNDALASLFGRTREAFADLCGQNPLACIALEDASAAKAALSRIAEKAVRVEGVVRIEHADATPHWLTISASVAGTGSDGTHIAIAALDATKEKAEGLRYGLLAEQQRQLFEAVPCGIVRYSIEESFRIESANWAACRILGYGSGEELKGDLGGNAFGSLVDDARDRMGDAITRLRAGSPPLPFDVRIGRADGTEGWIEGLISLTTTSDGLEIVQSAFNDVTQERREIHRRELQRFTSVLCSVYDEIFEFDLKRGTFMLWYSEGSIVKDARPIPIDDALARWFGNLPRKEDHDAILSTLEGYRTGTAEQTTTIACLCETGARRVWFESTFLRMSDDIILCCNDDVTERKMAEDEQLSRQISNVVANLPAGIGVYDIDRTGAHPLFVSDAVCDMVGVSRSEYDRRAADCYPALTAEEGQAFLDSHIDQDGFDFAAEKILERHGERFTARVQGRASRLDDGTVRVHVVVTDITDEVRQRRERAWQNERYRILSELTHAISFDYDSSRDEVLLYIDRMGKGMEAQIIPRYLETLDETRAGVVHPDSIETIRTMFEHAREGSENEIVEYCADYYKAGYQWYRANLFVTHDEGGIWHLVGLIENIEEERELRQRAECDAVTGLSNYASTRDLVNAALVDPHARARNVCAVIDLDDFKAVNDNCGHLKGDEMLKRVGEVLRGNCRESDVVGRVGGDEYVVFLKNIDLDTALRKLTAMKRAVSEMDVPPECVSVVPAPSVSIGATATRAEDLTYNDAFSRADKALYIAKRSGKNQVRIV